MHILLIDVYMYMCVHTYFDLQFSACMHAFIHTYMHVCHMHAYLGHVCFTYIRTCVHAHTHMPDIWNRFTRITCALSHTHAHTRTLSRACPHAHARTHALARVYTCSNNRIHSRRLAFGGNRRVCACACIVPM